MDPQTFEKLLLIAFGWFLGLFSPTIVDLIQRKQERKEIKTTLTSELQNLQFRLVGIVYLIAQETRTSIYDRQLLKWIQSTMATYTGINYDPALRDVVEALLKLNDQELATAATRAGAQKKEDGRLLYKLSLKKYSTPLLESQISRLSILDELSRQYVLEIRNRLYLINEDIDQYRFYFNHTFSSNISQDNYELTVKNINDAYVNISSQARLAANQIATLLSKWRW
ncbi:MAG: hypothetical protein WAW37_17065 [Syntrophobacteraceae bacterium]